MINEHPMLENILSLARRETWQRTLELAEQTIDRWLAQVAKPDFERIYLVGCGSSLYNGQAAKYALEALAGIPAEAVPAFTFSRYIPPKLLTRKTLVVGISTTGGTQAVCDALDYARRAGAPALAVTAHAESPVARLAEGTLLTGGEGDSMSVKTSSYVQALVALYVLAIRLAEAAGGGSKFELGDYWRAQILRAGEGAGAFLERQRAEIRYLARQYSAAPRVFALGVGANTGTAAEAALKVIEMAKLPAEAQELEDFFHGRLREVEQTSPLFFIAPSGPASGRVLDFLTATDHIQAPTVVLTDSVTQGIRDLATHIVQMPGGLDELFTPLLYILPLHLFGYELALLRGFDPNARRYNIVPQKVRYGERVEEIKPS